MLRNVAVAFCLLLLASSARADLIVNGDFSAGNTGFTSQYIHSQADIGDARTYAVVHSPGDARPSDHNGAALIDHTTGTGLLFAANGAETPNVIVWSETVAVVPHADYDFSLWLASWFAGSPATLDIRFNDVSIGTPAAPPSVNPWVQFTAAWNSGSASSLTLNIVDTNLADVGSDFALDDISLTGQQSSAVPAPSSLILAIAGASVLGCVWLFRPRSKILAGIS